MVTSMSSSTTLTLGILVGSLRAASITRSLACALAEVAPTTFHTSMLIAIDDLPLYNEDLDLEVAVTAPAPWTRFREQVRSCDAVLFVTPEYNRSIPAPLKNAIDVGSAPHEHNAFAGRPAAVVSASPGRMGAFGANHHLRQCLVFLDMPTMAQPELYLSDSHHLFGQDGQIRENSTTERLTAFMSRFATWAQQHAPVPA